MVEGCDLELRPIELSLSFSSYQLCDLGQVPWSLCVRISPVEARNVSPASQDVVMFTEQNKNVASPKHVR